MKRKSTIKQDYNFGAKTQRKKQQGPGTKTEKLSKVEKILRDAQKQIKKISNATFTRVSLIGLVKNNSISGSIKLNDIKSKIPKKLGYVHKF